MLTTEIYKGQGLGNQLACYVTTRVIALDKGYDFGIMHPENFKGLDFFDLDFGHKVSGGKGPDGGPPTVLPDGIEHYYNEQKILHPVSGADIRLYDKNLVNVSDNTKIDGLMQDEQYILHRKEEIRQWLKVRAEYECNDYADDNTCVINFRGGEYARHKDFFLHKKYWTDAIHHMRAINKNFRFIVITDDVFTAKKFFPDFGVFHFSIAKDYVIIKNAHYLILSNSSFAWFPAWLSNNLKFCIAPKYWGRHNISDGYWSLGQNITKGWMYQDRDGVLSDYDTCISELHRYMAREESNHNNIPQQKQHMSIATKIKKNLPPPVKNFLKSCINIEKNTINYIRRPIDIIKEKKRKKEWLSKIEIAEYRKKIKVYDAFNFFNELETLEIRLHILNDYVDYFVIVESTLTHSGKPKELFYQKNKHLFKEFEHKIIHYVIEHPLKNFEDARQRLTDPNTTENEKIILQEALSSDNIQEGENSFLRDFYEKESVKNALVGLSDDDFCFISDLDEIWNPEAFIDFSKNDVFKLKQDCYIYYLNNRSNEDWNGWTGTIGTKYKNIKNSCLNHLRTDDKTTFTIIRDGGWHFTFQGGENRVRTKIESYSHQEINNDSTKEKIGEALTKNKDIKGRKIKFWKDESKLPKYLLEHKDKYKEFFK